MRRLLIALLALPCLFSVPAGQRAVAADVPTVTIMQAGSDELKIDIEFLMKLAGKEGEQQWPVVEQIVDVFLDGVDGKRPMRVDLILGKDPDTRLSIPVADEKSFLTNVGGFIGAGDRRMGGGLYLFKPKPPALSYYARLLGPARTPDWGIIAEDRGNLPANFQVLGAIQPLLNAGFDLAATVENTKDGVDDRRGVIKDLEKEVTATLAQLDGETDNEFAMRKLGLGHQFRELERIYAESEQLTLGWTTDSDKQEGRLDLELTALADTDLANSISQLAAQPSRFASVSKSEASVFFGRVNHALDEMRQKHFTEMFELMEKDATERLAASSDFTDEQKAGVTTAIQKGFQMLRDGTQMGVVDGFIDVDLKDGSKSVVGAIRVVDGAVAVEVLQGLKQAGWEVEIGGASESASDADTDTEKKDAEADTEKKDVEAENAAEAESEEKTAEASEGDQADAEPAKADDPQVAIHSVTLPEKLGATIKSLFGSTTFIIATADDAVYYAAGDGAEERLKAAIAADGQAAAENDGMFLEAWYRVGPIIDVLRERRERREADLDLSKLTPEEKSERKEREERRARAEQAFAGAADTIHTKLQRQDGKVIGQTVLGVDVLRFVGLELTNVAKTKLQ